MNVLRRDRRRDVLRLLLEGCSIRAVNRLTGVHKTTITNLLVAAGQHCQALLDAELCGLPCPIIQADEIWTFVRKKQARVTAAEQGSEFGDQYLYIGLDPRSKLIAAHVVGKRDAETTTDFIEQLHHRIPGRLQLFTDGFYEYVHAVDGLYGEDGIHYAQVIKPRGRGLEIIVWYGQPALPLIGTSYVERHNGTIRHQIRRFTRCTLAFSKRLRNLRAAATIYVAWYDFCREHGSLKMTPAMALGIADTFWPLDRLLP